MLGIGFFQKDFLCIAVQSAAVRRRPTHIPHILITQKRNCKTYFSLSPCSSTLSPLSMLSRLNYNIPILFLITMLQFRSVASLNLPLWPSIRLKTLTGVAVHQVSFPLLSTAPLTSTRLSASTRHLSTALHSTADSTTTAAPSLIPITLLGGFLGEIGWEAGARRP